MHKTSGIPRFQSFLLMAAETACSDCLLPAIALSASGRCSWSRRKAAFRSDADGELTPHDTYRLAVGYQYGWPDRLQVSQRCRLRADLDCRAGSDSTIPIGWSLSVQLPDGAGGYTSGSAAYGAAIQNCVGQPVSIGQYLPTENMGGGQTKIGFDGLKAKDPNAMECHDQVG
jgi:hypothetical protein